MELRVGDLVEVRGHDAPARVAGHGGGRDRWAYCANGYRPDATPLRDRDLDPMADAGVTPGNTGAADRTFHVDTVAPDPPSRSGSAAVWKATVWPSGDQAGDDPSATNCRGGPPAAATSQTPPCRREW